MNDQDLETKMRLEALRSFDVYKEKDKFMTKLALANITPPTANSAPENVVHQKKKGILLGSSLSFLLIACAVGVGLGFGLRGDTPPVENMYKAIVFTTLTIETPNRSRGPEFDLTIGVDGQVNELVPSNAEAKIVYGSNKHEKKDLNSATKDILGLAADTGFLAKAANRENANNIRVFVSGESTDVTKAKTEVASSVKSYLSVNKIYAYVSDQTIGNAELDRLEQLYSLPKEKCLILLKIYELSSSYSKLTLEETVLKYKDKSLSDLNTLVSNLSNNSSSIGPVFDFEDLMKEIEGKTAAFKAQTKDFHQNWSRKIRDFSRALSSLERDIQKERCKADLSFIDEDIFDSDDLELEDVFDYIHKTFPDIFRGKHDQRGAIKNRGGHEEEDDVDDDRDDEEDKNDDFDDFDDDDFDDWWEESRPGHGGNKTCSSATKGRIEELRLQSEELVRIKAEINGMVKKLQNEIVALINEHKDELTQQVEDEKKKYDSLHNKYLEDYKDRDDRDEDFYNDFDDYFEDFFEKNSNFNRR